MHIQRESVIGIAPMARPDPRLAAAVEQAGGIGVLDLGVDHDAGLRALAEAGGAMPFTGIRVQAQAPFLPDEVPAGITTVIVESSERVETWKPRRVLVQCTSLEEARAAVLAGADGIIAKGSESGGRVGSESAFVLLQRLVPEIALPIWVQGGVGLYTAGACILGGAAGVVLDSQLALMAESQLDAQERSLIAALDGGETAVAGGRRTYVRPGAPAASNGAESPAGAQAPLELELGQDVAFAAHFGERYKTVRKLLSAIRAGIRDGLEAAADEAPLAPQSPLARQHGIRYPIAQGPMTRVSDTAAFADAVSRGGALPFVALALMRGPEVRQLLVETAARLEGRPWGVGVLGFVPPELREEQIEVIRELKPHAALIAGGRPAQAKPLEENGIFTYLHVPSPGLLDMFLKQGARHFVFEGQECGGHIGPRSSFVLWESQVQRLMEHPAPSELSILFAGGIHDARSAAMVSALAAPLARRGAKVGVLMGTAYLFTEEAVSSGAIKQSFQDAALACESTVLLETAPGHSTRCADTEYVAAFRAEHQRLTAEGLPPQEVWAALETLNLGRLRIASKGVVREGDQLVVVDEETSRREGMVMLGEVAALHSELTTIEALHREVTTGARDFVESRPLPRSNSEDVAIVGMAAIMPGAADTGEFWSNIVRGIDSIREVPADRWNTDVFFDPDSMDGEKTPSKWGGFIDPVAFDPLKYGIPPLSLAAIEPVQLLSLEVSRRALEDGGYAERYFDRERTSVIFGAEAGSDLSSAYGFRALWRKYIDELPPELEAVLPKMTEDSFAGILSNVISGRIANRLDLGGLNFTVDAACAASLAAINLAAKELVSGTSDMIICGGADLHNGIVDYLAFASVHALSANGQCRTFDASADGIALGEGVAAVLLKRLADAERDGDRIYAVIKSVGGASDGKSLGLTAPRAQGQVRTLERAYRQARISPADVQLVEAHGTGTVVGDRTELESLDLVFRREGAEAGSITLGSVKSQIGHTKCSAGIAGLIKVAYSLYNRVLPATLNLSEPNPAWSADSPFSLNTSPRPWVGSDRKAGVSAFGFGGTNFHAVLQEYETRSEGSGYSAWPHELFLFRGATNNEALARVSELQSLLRRDEKWRLRDLARSVSAGDAPVRIAVVAGDIDDLRDKLTKAATLQVEPGGVFMASDAALGESPRVAFLYPGQGSQATGMLADLFVAFPALQRFLELDPALARTMFPPTAWDESTRAKQQAALTDTRAAQPALGIGGLAVTELLRWLGITPDMVAGHSYGELPALQAAGVLSEADLVALSSLRGHCILEAASVAGDSGAMAAIAAGVSDVERVIAGVEGVAVANINSGEQTVISGTTQGVTAAVQRLSDAKFSARLLDVACAFHSPVVAAASQTFLRELENVPVSEPSLPVFSNTGGGLFPTEPAAIRERLAGQVAAPVQFVDVIEAMYENGARIFVEAGPGRVLTGLTSQILKSRPHAAIAVDVRRQHGVTQLMKALAQLAVLGVTFDADKLYEGRDARLFALNDASSSKPAATSWWVDGQRAWPVTGAPPSHAMLPVRDRLGFAQTQPAAAASIEAPNSEREVVVMEYLRGVRELVETQRRVMLSYLGADAGAAASPLPATVERPAAVERPPAVAHSNGAHVEVPAPAAQPVAASTSPAVAPQRDTATILLEIISARTGYPIEMLGLDLDLEADLSIDSIKRIEILGALAESLGLNMQSAMDELPDDLVSEKTLRGIIEAVGARQPAAPPPPLVEPVLVGASNGHSAPPATSNGHHHVDPRTALLEVVSTRTGYPVDMLGMELDLEADLSIDSIKRIEILGALAEKLGLVQGGAMEELPEDLVTVKTLQGILDAFAAMRPAGQNGQNGQHQVETVPEPSPVAAVAEAVRAPRGRVPRYVPVQQAIDTVEAEATLKGQSFSVYGDPKITSELVERLRDFGATVKSSSTLAGQGAFVDVTALASDWTPSELAGVFERCRDALVAGATSVAVVCLENSRGGFAGMARTLTAEWPDRSIKALVLGSESPDGNADLIVKELSKPSSAVVTLSPDGDFTTGFVPAEVSLESELNVRLDSRSVVLITGGARGITGRIAYALASRFQCRLELVGRSPEPEGDEDPAYAAAPDLPSLRRAVIARGELREPAQIEAFCARVLSEREIRETLTSLRNAGSRVRYHAVDVRDEAALAGLIDEIYERYGRIDVAIHGAGVLEDKLATEKTVESFNRVFETKVAGARTLVSKLRDDLQCLVFFSSVVGAFGNRGQVDYAAANDYLDWLASTHNRSGARRIVSIGWGPWANGGMVSPELAREYARRGIELIEPEEGAEAFMTELLVGPRDHAHVLLMRAFPTGMA